MGFNIANLPALQIIEILKFTDIRNENIKELKKLIPNYQPLDSDPFMKLIDVFSYKEMFLRERINNSLKAMFLPTSTGADLDNLAVFYSQERLKGSKPYAIYEFELSAVLEIDVTIPKNTELSNSGNSVKSYVEKDTVIKAGDKSADIRVILNKNVLKYLQQTEIITTPIPYLAKVKSKTIFENGSDLETDNDFRNRIIQSLSSFATAGSISSYEYHTYTSDNRIDDVSIVTENAGVVDVYISAKVVDDVMINRVRETLNNDKTRPLTDKPNVLSAEVISLQIDAQIILFDISQQTTIKEKIQENLQREFQIGEDFILSDIVQSLHIDGVYKVDLKYPIKDIIVNNKQVIKLLDVMKLEFVGFNNE